MELSHHPPAPKTRIETQAGPPRILNCSVDVTPVPASHPSHFDTPGAVENLCHPKAHYLVPDAVG